MKRKTAKELLADSFRELAATKGIDRITIRDIVENCGYSPATFYRNFKDKYDLIAWEYSRELARIMGQVDGVEYEWKQILMDGAMYYQEHREYLANLFRHTSGQDSFFRYMVELNYESLKKHILAVSGKKELEAKDAMYVRIYCLGTVSLTCEWILGAHGATAEEIAEVYENSLPEPLRKYLF